MQELQACREELARGMSQKNRDSIAAAYCHLGEYYAYRQADSTRYYCELGLKYAATDKAEPYLYLLNNLADAYFSSGAVGRIVKAFPFCARRGRTFALGRGRDSFRAFLCRRDIP